MALAHPTPLPFPASEGSDSVFQPQQQDLVVEFAEQFTQLQGKFIFCVDSAELVDMLQHLIAQKQWKNIFSAEEKFQNLFEASFRSQDLTNCDASITSCETLVARTGSIVLSSAQQGRLASVYAPVHVCIAYTSQLVYDVKDGLESITKKYKGFLPSVISFATGPSRTADIEKTLVVGVHGPKEVYCFVVDDGNIE